MRERPIVITGAAGFVGTAMVRKLRDALPGVPVVTMVRRRRSSPNDISLDLNEIERLRDILARTRPRLIVHLAAYASVGTSRRDPAAVWQDNRDASFALAKAVAAAVPDATIIVSGTTEVYGTAFLDGPVSEMTPPSPRGPYGVSKLAGEWVMDAVLPQSTRLVLCRPVNHTGPGQVEDFVIPSLAGQIARAEAGITSPDIAVGNLDACREFLHVDDVVESYIALIKAADTLPMRAVYNVGSGRPVPIRTILDYFLAKSQRPIEERVDPARLRPNDIPTVSVKFDRLVAATGWQPARSLEDTLQAVLDDKRQSVRNAARA